jgi:hypothetical protein
MDKDLDIDKVILYMQSILNFHNWIVKNPILPRTAAAEIEAEIDAIYKKYAK